MARYGWLVMVLRADQKKTPGMTKAIQPVDRYLV